MDPVSHAALGAACAQAALFKWDKYNTTWVVWTAVFSSRKGVVCGLVFAGLLVVVNLWQQHRAFVAVEKYTPLQHWHINKLRVFPDIASTTWWRAIALINNQQVFVVNLRVPLFAAPSIYAPETFPLFKQTHLPPYVAHTGEQLRDYRVFNWFTDGYLIKAQKNPLVLVDGRFLVGYKPTIGL